jgi:hypothetical protein
MSDWGPNTFGDPCWECGFSWVVPVDGALELVRHLRVAYAAALAGATGKERHPELSWSVGPTSVMWETTCGSGPSVSPA